MAHKVLSHIALRDWIQKKKNSNWNLQRPSTLRFLNGWFSSCFLPVQQPIISIDGHVCVVSPMFFQTVWDQLVKGGTGRTLACARPRLQFTGVALAGIGTQHLPGRTLSDSVHFG